MRSRNYDTAVRIVHGDLKAKFGTVPSRATVARLLASDEFKRKKKRLRPRLTEDHMKARFQWASQFQNDNWFGTVDLDEKWAYAVTYRKLIIPREDDTPTKQVQSKRFVGKVMYLSGVSPPDKEFDGKLGIWRFTESKLAVRTTKYRTAGIEYDTDVNVTAQVFKKMFVDNVIPAIRAKMAHYDIVYAQIDNARAHTGGSVLDEVMSEVNAEGVRPRIVFRLQPANSPDTNANDLFFFKYATQIVAWLTFSMQNTRYQDASIARR